jgi:hypothetical protein
VHPHEKSTYYRGAKPNQGIVDVIDPTDELNVLRQVRVVREEQTGPGRPRIIHGDDGGRYQTRPGKLGVVPLEE